MPIAVTPAECPACAEPFRLTYADYRAGRMSFRARAALLVGVALTVVLLPTFLVLIGERFSEWTAGLGLRRKERGLLFALAYAVSVPVALLPAWVGWRYGLSRPRRTTAACPACPWSGPVWVADTSPPVRVWRAPPVRAEGGEFEGMGYLPDPLRARRERLDRRLEEERRRERESLPEPESNPDLDFRDRPDEPRA